MIRFTCPQCKKLVQAPESAAGEKLACPACGQPIVVPPAPVRLPAWLGPVALACLVLAAGVVIALLPLRGRDYYGYRYTARHDLEAIRAWACMATFCLAALVVLAVAILLRITKSGAPGK